MPSETVGFIGLGIMGRPMALNLIKAGYRLVVTSRSRGPIDALAAAGATAAATPADVAREADVVITMVPDSPDVEQVIAGERGVLEGLRPGSIVIDMSTISPIVTRRLSAAVAAKGGSMLDAPVSGGDIGAKNATLTIMVGGDERTFERARPILSCMGKPESVTYIGPSGAGQVTKLCNQIAIGGALAGVAEAFALAKASGIDRGRVRQALLGGFAGSKVLEFHGNRMLTGNYKPGFFMRLFQKDLRLTNEAGLANGVAMPVTAVVTHFVSAVVNAGGGEMDCAAAAETWFALSEGTPVDVRMSRE
ncbi:MAG TPA: NAD(P)-dependent oxidoreductase [Vicinamibacterales bacterium]|nr:NAD(P)-dependent oxidoreductase [Vicinamibacterales bacterium]